MIAGPRKRSHKIRLTGRLRIPIRGGRSSEGRPAPVFVGTGAALFLAADLEQPPRALTPGCPGTPSWAPPPGAQPRPHLLFHRSFALPVPAVCAPATTSENSFTRAHASLDESGGSDVHGVDRWVAMGCCGYLSCCESVGVTPLSAWRGRWRIVGCPPVLLQLDGSRDGAGT